MCEVRAQPRENARHAGLPERGHAPPNTRAATAPTLQTTTLARCERADQPEEQRLEWPEARLRSVMAALTRRLRRPGRSGPSRRRCRRWRGGDLDVRAGVGCLDEQVVADVDADVVEGVEEHEVAG